jgi:hypothetical protein
LLAESLLSAIRLLIITERVRLIRNVKATVMPIGMTFSAEISRRGSDLTNNQEMADL